MSLSVNKSDYFLDDIELTFRWYERNGNWEVAEGYLSAIDSSLNKLTLHPEMGVKCHFTEPELADLRFCLVERPYQSHLIFYRFDQQSFMPCV